MKTYSNMSRTDSVFGFFTQSVVKRGHMELGYFLTEAGCNQHDPEKTPWIPKDVPRSPQKHIHTKLSIYADSSHSDLDLLTHLATNLLSVATHRKGIPGLDCAHQNTPCLWTPRSSAWYLSVGPIPHMCEDQATTPEQQLHLPTSGILLCYMWPPPVCGDTTPS